MNLSDILDSVAYALSHDPQNKREKAHRQKVVNEVYQEVLDQEQWQFLEKVQRDFVVVPPLQITYTGALPTVSKSIIVTLPVALSSLSLWKGARVEVYNDGALATAFETYVVNVADQVVWLSSELVIPGTVQEVVFKFYPRYRLADDLTEIKGIVDRMGPRGPVTMVDLSQEQWMVLDGNESPDGQPNEYSSNRPDAFLLEQPERLDLGPTVAPTVTAAAGSALFAPDTVYRYMYTWERNGRESPPSPIVEIRTPIDTSDYQVNVTVALYSTGQGTTVYRAVGEAGAFYRLGVAEPSTASGVQPFADPGEDLSGDTTRWQSRSTYRYVRFWPRLPEVQVANPADLSEATKAKRNLEVRYLYRPQELTAATDVPVLPVQHHQLLMHGAVARLAAKRDDKGLLGFHRASYDEGLRLMARRYKTEVAASYRFRQWTSSLHGSRTHRPNPRKV